MTLAAGASAAPGAEGKPAPSATAEAPGAASSQDTRPTAKHLYYELNTPMLVFEYDEQTSTCKSPIDESKQLLTSRLGPGTLSVSYALPKSDGVKSLASRKERFIIVRTISAKSATQYVIRTCSHSGLWARLGFCRPDNGEDGNSKDVQPGQLRQDKYYCLDKSTLDAMVNSGEIARKYDRGYKDLVYGLNLTLPLKLRPAIHGFNTTVDKDIQLGGFLGARWRISDSSDYYVDLPVVSIGLTTLSLAKGTVPGAMDTSKETMGVSASTGIVVELSDFQLGIMMGVDRATGDAGRDWRYNGKTWYSFGLGYTFVKSK